MSGYNLIRKIKNLEEECAKIGLVMCPAKEYHNSFGDLVAVKPKDNESLPPYSRDAEIFIGTLNDLERWLQGIEWARKYDRLLFGHKNDEKRIRKEQDFRNDVLVKIIKGEKNVDVK